VVNFYELRGFTHVKTVPVMEELEGIAILNSEHSQQLLSSSSGITAAAGKGGKASKLVLATAGEAGVLKFFAFEMASREAGGFEISALLHFPLSAAQRQLSPADAQSISKSSASAATAGSKENDPSLQGIASLHYLPKTGELLSVTKDYNLCSYAM
jgi:hypothetical protein